LQHHPAPSLRESKEQYVVHDGVTLRGLKQGAQQGFHQLTGSFLAEIHNNQPIIF